MDENQPINKASDQPTDENFSVGVIAHLVIRDVQTDSILINQRG